VKTKVIDDIFPKYNIKYDGKGKFDFTDSKFDLESDRNAIKKALSVIDR